MFQFKFGEKQLTKSPPYDFLAECDATLRFKIKHKLEIIEKNINKTGFEQIKGTKAFKEIKVLKKQKVKLFQVNEKYTNKREYRVLFILKSTDIDTGLIVDIFLKKSESEQQKHYKQALKRAEYYN